MPNVIKIAQKQEKLFKFGKTTQKTFKMVLKLVKIS